MALYSTLGKSLVALLMAGGGVTGVVLGVNGNKGGGESQVTEHLIQQDSQKNHSDLTEDRIQGPSSESSAVQGTSHLDTKEEKPLSPVLSQGEKAMEPERKETFKPALEEASSSTEAKQEPEVKAPEPEKANPPSLPKVDVKAPKSAALKKERPRRQRPARPMRPSSRGSEVVAEPVPAKNEDFSSKNWFYVKWSANEDLDDSAWTIDECSKNINGDTAVFTCPWNEDPSKMIELHLSLSSDTDLKTKKWESLEELTFSSKVANLATLELTFSDNREEILTLFLDRKNS